MIRIQIINSIIKKIKAKSYLEIGIDSGDVFRSILCKHKVAVDPVWSTPATHHLTSDDFFIKNKETFDIIFIDGLHHADQVEKDIKNSLSILNEGGVIICHDLLPENYEQQVIPFVQGKWTGDVWKAFVKLRQTAHDLQMFTVDVDMGLGIITRGKQEVVFIDEDEEVSYENFSKKKFDWLKIISLEDFYGVYLNEPAYSNLLLHFINTPEDGLVNFHLGYFYEKLGQTASAISFYLRAAERTQEEVLRYEALLRASICFDLQGSRGTSVIGLLQHAVALLPKRPEAYFLLSRYYEREKRWFDGYMIASIGEKIVKEDHYRLRTEVNYPGSYGILFEKAVCGWWCGLVEESVNLLRTLMYFHPLDNLHREAVKSNLSLLNLWMPTEEVSWFSSKEEEIKKIEAFEDYITMLDLKNLKIPFENQTQIKFTFSEFCQDLFVLTCSNGKKNGTYVEVGAGHPFFGNNTALLETEYGWKGISIDYSQGHIEEHFKHRQNGVLLADAATLDYDQLFKNTFRSRDIDYLQVDCDPATTSLQVLKSIPFDKYRFRVITFEHDHYQDNTGKVREDSRKFLQQKGYRLILSNIGKDDKAVEDWWVNPKLVNLKALSLIVDTSSLVKSAKSLFLQNP